MDDDGPETGRKNTDAPESDRYRKLADAARGLRATQGRKPSASKAREAHRQAGAWLRYTTAGLQFVVVLLLPLGGGYWVDVRFDTLPWFTLVGFGLGAAAAMGGLIREVMRMDADDVKRAQKDAEKDAEIDR